MEITGWLRFRQDKEGLLYPLEDRFASESDNKADVLLEDTWVHGAWKVILGYKKPLDVGIQPVPRVFPRIVWRKVRCNVAKCTCGKPDCVAYQEEFRMCGRRAVLVFEVFIEIE